MQRVDTSTAVAQLPGQNDAGIPGYFTQGNSASGLPATVPGQDWFNGIQEELITIILAAGITPDKAITNQILQAIKRISNYYSVTTGSDNVYMLTLSPEPDAYIEGMPIMFKASFSNTDVATLNINGLGAKALKKNIIDALEPGDIQANKIYIVIYDGTNIQVLNPSITNHNIKSITATVNANALTLEINPCTLDFRNATLTNGVPNSRIISSALSLIVPSGATLGTGNDVAARLVLLAIDNAGTVETAIVNLAGGNNLDETTLISTTAISDAADLNNVIYSANARTNVPFRIVGFIDITESAAGTWVTGPTLVQGCGGQVLAALSSIGYGQTWQNVTASRALGTTYYNTTGKPILISVSISYSALVDGTCTVNGVVVVRNGSGGSQTGILNAIVTIVPPGGSYVISNNGTVQYWVEMR
ncbi:MAG: hypothetical protein ABFD57_09695 [Smithella sp.]